jgi:hypothetical protein
MKLIKIKHAHAKYVTISQICIEDPRLSWGAKGLFAYLHGRPEKWEVNYCDLINRSSSDGKSKLNKYIKELQRYGYLKIEKIKDESGRWAGAVGFTDDEPETVGIPAQTVAESHSTPHPGLPYHGKTVYGKTVSRKNSTIQYNNTKIKDSKQQQQQPPAPHPVVVCDFGENIKLPCQSKKCNNFKDIDQIKRAVEIFNTASTKKTIKNPIGYICGICKKGAVLPPDHESEAERAARREAEQAQKAAAERAAADKAAAEAAAQEAFALLPDVLKANYINKIQSDMPVKLSAGVIFALAASKWAKEANYAG